MKKYQRQCTTFRKEVELTHSFGSPRVCIQYLPLVNTTIIGLYSNNACTHRHTDTHTSAREKGSTGPWRVQALFIVVSQTKASLLLLIPSKDNTS